MEATLVGWLDQVGRMTFMAAAVLFVVINGVAIVGFFGKRDQQAVNRWTGRVLAADLLLIGAGVGVPLVTTMTRLTVTTVAASLRGAGFGPSAAMDRAMIERP